MTFRETLRDSVIGESVAPVTTGRPRKIWGTDGRLDSHEANERSTIGDLAVTTTLTQAVARALLPISVMVGVAMLIKGYTDTGDGFSAGVILALGAVTQVACFGIGVVDRIPILRYAPVAAYIGLILALGIAFVPLAFGDPLFTHWPPAGDSPAHLGTLEIITAVGFDISVCLLVFGFIVGTMTLLARTASVSSIQQAQGPERLRQRGEPYASSARHPTASSATGAGPDLEARRIDETAGTLPAGAEE